MMAMVDRPDMIVLPSRISRRIIAAAAIDSNGNCGEARRGLAGRH
jgi:hypothetical protein